LASEIPTFPVGKRFLLISILMLLIGYVWSDALLSGEPAAGQHDARVIVATGYWGDVGVVPGGFDPAFARALIGWNASKGGSAAACHFAVRPSGKYIVAIGLFDPQTPPGMRLQDIVIDGRKVETLDPAGPRPFVRLYEAADLNGDGYLQVSCSQAKDESGATGLMNIVWLFEADQKDNVDAEQLARGGSSPAPLLRLDAASANRKPRGHVNYPSLPDAQQKRMLPLRPVALGIEPARPQPADPLHLEIQGELRGRIRRVLDRWGYAGRDQKLVAGFLADAGFDTSGRALEVFCMLSRLMKVDLDVQVPFEALLARQERSGDQAGAFLGGAGTPRLACSWEQGTVLQAMMAYYEYSGDRRALEAAGRIVDWEERMVAGKISTGSWGGNGRYGALEGLTNYYWRTKDPKALDVAKRIAEMNHGPQDQKNSSTWSAGVASGGIPWMIRGEPGQDHLHSCATTIRGFPWLYAETGDRSYLDDAIAACDRIYDTCTWANGCVAEFTNPEAKHCFSNDEGCCTADELMLSCHLADLTGEGRFFDRSDDLYYNALRFHQWFDGNFNGYSDPFIDVKGPHMWYCCTWWGAKALYETARHLYASSPTDVYVNGFMPSRAELPLKNGVVGIATEAKIPESGDVRIILTPKGSGEFALHIRVPGWAVLHSVEVNGQAQQTQAQQGYLALRRTWRPGDRIDVHFDLPLRVVLDNSQGPTPLAVGKVRLDGAEQAPARSIVIYRGPVILAQFRLQNGCDLIWAYTGDDPYLFETVASVPDEFVLGGKPFRSTGVPDLVEATRSSSGVRLDWTWKTGPAGDWEVRRSASIKNGLPLEIEYTAELAAPSAAPADQVEEAVRTGRFCGIRMPYSVSETFTYFDNTSHRIPPRLVLDGAPKTPAEGQWLSAKKAELDSGSVQHRVHATAHNLTAGDKKEANYSAIYGAIEKKNGRFITKCRLTISGQSQFD
jgi:hypothetical protein